MMLVTFNKDHEKERKKERKEEYIYIYIRMRERNDIPRHAACTDHSPAKQVVVII